MGAMKSDKKSDMKINNELEKMIDHLEQTNIARALNSVSGGNWWKR